MSIIAEALKKAQKKEQPILSTEGKNLKQPKIGPSLISVQNKSSKRPFSKKKHSFVLGGIFFGALLLMSLTTILSYFQNMQRIYFGQTSINSPTPSFAEKTEKPLPPEQTVTTADISKTVEEKIFKLSGIVQDKDKPLAVINDRILEVGQIINGATVVAIRNDLVKLSLKGEFISLYLEN